MKKAEKLSTESPKKPSTKLSPNNGLIIYKRLASYTAKHWRYLVMVIVGLVISGATIPLFAVYMQPFAALAGWHVYG